MTDSRFAERSVRPRMRGRRRAVVAVATALVAGAAFWAVRVADERAPAPTPVQLKTAGADGWKAGAALPSTTAGKPYTFGAIPVCLTSPGRVVIDAIRPEDTTGGLRVSGFAVRSVAGDLFGAEQTTLAAAGFTGAHEVTSVCGPELTPDELAVEVTKATAINARGGNLLADWHNNSSHGTLSIPFHIVLCQGSDTTTTDCKSW